MEPTTMQDVTRAAAESGYVAAMVDAIEVVKRTLGVTAQALAIAEELQRLANTKPDGGRR